MSSRRERRTSPPTDEYPICGCQAGVCRRVSQTSGRYQFVCPIPRGQGSCGFVKWQGTDEAGGSSVVTSDEGHENNVDGVQEYISEDVFNEISRIEEIEAHEMSSHQGEDPVQAVIEEEFVSESTTDGSVFSDKFGSSTIGNIESLNESRLIDQGRQVVVHTNSVSAAGITIQNYVLGNSNQQSNLFCMEGWWGRIAYSPSRSLILSRKRPLSSCSAETLSVGGEDLQDRGSEKRSKPNPCSSITYTDSSSLQSSREQVTVMAGTISRAIDDLAVGIMNDLVTVLESMNPKDHKTMSDEAAVTFKTLSSLGINFTIFRDRVTGYIERAKHLSSLETTSTPNQWTSDLMSRCNTEKSLYEDIVSAHSRAEAAVLASIERLQSARREASYVKELLVEAEMELASCEADTADNQARLLRVSEELVRSKRRWENASKEAAEAVKRCEEREVEMNAAKAAFDTAKTQLRRGCC